MYKIIIQADDTLCIELYARGLKKPVGYINVYNQDNKYLDGKVRVFTTIKDKHVSLITDVCQ